MEQLEAKEKDTVHVTLRLPIELHRQALGRLGRFGGKFQWLLLELTKRWIDGDIDLNKGGHKGLASQGLTDDEAEVIRAIRNPLTRDERMLKGVVKDWLEIKRGGD